MSRVAPADEVTDTPVAEIDHGDGRLTLDKSDPRLVESRYCNDDLAPTSIEQRHWGLYNYTALWVGMSHCIPSYLLASGLVALGMNWVQAIICIGAANLIVLVPMLLNGHARTKYGIPFPVFARGPRCAWSELRRDSARVDRVCLVRHPDVDRRGGHLRVAGQARRQQLAE